MISTLIFDFDGTLADSVDIKTDAFAELYKPYGKKIVDKVIKYHLSNGGISRYEKIKYFHKNLLKINPTDSEVQNIATHFSDIVINKVINASYLPGAYEFVNSNHLNYNLFISSATPEEELKQILYKKGISRLFKGIYGSPSSKTEHINVIMKNGFNHNETVFVGDSIDDYKAAINSKINFIGVSSIKDRKNKFPNNVITINDIRELNKINDMTFFC